jgi:hypothetical protein
MFRIRSSGNKETDPASIAFLRVQDFTGWRGGQLLFWKPNFVLTVWEWGLGRE